MMEVELSPESERDLEKIREYLNEEFGEFHMKKAMKSLLDSIRGLSVNPKQGFDIGSRYGIETDYYCLITKKNYVFYRLEDPNKVKIIRCLDFRQNFMQILFGV